MQTQERILSSFFILNKCNNSSKSVHFHSHNYFPFEIYQNEKNDEKPQ